MLQKAFIQVSITPNATFRHYLYFRLTRFTSYWFQTIYQQTLSDIQVFIQIVY